jgi:cyclase
MKKNPILDAEFFYGASPEIFFRAGQLRKNMTDAEKFLWSELRNKKLGFTFRGQHPINIFIADFYCHKARLAVEVDGSIHEIEGSREKDRGRDDEFSGFGILTLRFSNEEIFRDLESVVYKIKSECQKRVPLPASPSGDEIDQK